jgi:RNA-binding protein
MQLTLKQKKHLRNLAHNRRPVVIIGQQGLTENVSREVDQALDHHELVKVRVNAADREDRARIVESLSSETGAELVQQIGHIAVFYRRNRQKPKISLREI